MSKEKPQRSGAWTIVAGAAALSAVGAAAVAAAWGAGGPATAEGVNLTEQRPIAAQATVGLDAAVDPAGARLLVDEWFTQASRVGSWEIGPLPSLESPFLKAQEELAANQDVESALSLIHI